MLASPRHAKKFGGEELVFNAPLPPLAKLVLLAMRHYMRGEGTLRMSISGLADALGIHRVTCQRLVSDLRERGIVSRSAAGLTIAWDVLAASQWDTSPADETVKA
jgi:DNA-binding IclR family transcriptional regulator